jgi:hypothetical protein
MKDLHARSALALLAASVIGIASCASQQVVSQEAVQASHRAAAMSDEYDFATRARHQEMLVGEISEVEGGLTALLERGGWRERGYFDADEHDDIEALIFRLIAIRSAFWGVFDELGGLDLAQIEAGDQARAHLLVLHAGLTLAESGTFVVSTFAADEIAIAKINEAYYRTAVEPGTYARLQLGSTSRKRREQLAAAWALHEALLADDGSPLARLIALEPVAAALSAQIEALHARTLANIDVIDRADDMPGRVEHAAVAQLGRKMTSQLGDASYATRALVFKDVSRLRKPALSVIAFSPEQKSKIFGLLAPGDLILTFTGGHISDVFIPGNFKHGITYVGDAAQRRAAGVTTTPPNAPAGAPALARLADNVGFETFPDGSAADVVEAIAEGVKFSNFENILDTHVNRVLVLRPHIDAAERAVFLMQVMSYIGDPYDFRFDFADASRQVCTEVIYRGLDGKGGIEFTLTSRGGHPTLSADDIVLLHLASQGARFEVIFYAEGDPQADDNRAVLLEGPAAQSRVVTLMAPE